jgi:hypothetical protein
MRTFTLLLLALDLLLGLGFSCAAPPRGAQVSGPLGVVRFPAPWVKSRGGALVGVNDHTQYVIRRAPAERGGELLFAVKQGFDGSLFGKEVYDFPVRDPEYDYYSDDRFAVSLDGARRVREVTAAEWDAALKPLHSYRFIASHQNPAVTGEGVEYGGRLYRKSGASWGTEAALVSPRSTRIAVFSYASSEQPRKPLVPGLGGTEPGHGEIFLDVYDLSSGERVMAARAPYGATDAGYSPSLLFGGALWVDDRFFVMPLEPSYESCFLGILPEK